MRPWRRTEGKSERCIDPRNPISSDDFMLTLAGLAARLDWAVDKREGLDSSPPRAV
jgi:hypothetical protein